MIEHDSLVEYKHYNQLFSSCFSQMNIPKVNDTFRSCNPYKLCYNKSHYANNSVDFENIELSGSLMNPYSFYSNNTAEIWKQEYDVLSLFDYNILISKLIKTILYPNMELINNIRSEQTFLFRRSFKVGLQLRMNGKPPVNKYTGIGFENLTQLINDVTVIVKSHGFTPLQTTLYISTDTPSVIQSLQSISSEYAIVESTLYIHGHTGTGFSKYKLYPNITRKVISDFINVVSSDIALVTWRSSLGRMMCMAMFPKPCLPIFNLTKE